MVLIKEDFLPINTWPLGRILEVYHGSDGKVRVVKVKTQSGEFKRAISKIAVLPIDTNPTPLAHADTSRDVLPRGGASQWRPTRFNLYDPEVRNKRGFNVWPKVYFSGSENVTEFLEVLGSTLEKNTATDFAQLKAVLSKAFPAIQNKKELETQLYASQQRQNPEPTDFVYDLLKIHKKLELGMSEKALVDHIFVRLEPQVQYYVEVRNPQTAFQLLEVLAKFEERYSCKATLGSRKSNNVEG
ncbi:uncharacterized protein TNCV_1917151 [Trichonephila clavipes]|uniref:DUF5641 domain-containing protein n=1 Tax=Trichonephila clavipes TaxID=2585209 RepID=A0A8X7BBK3_TRICX|nr:uncharacterized protein TNCV_1917151 [Trichonephila clavipes]